MIADRIGVAGMTILDTELQFDGNKLIIYYTPANGASHVDFRGLQRALFREFGCRIWFTDWADVRN